MDDRIIYRKKSDCLPDLPEKYYRRVLLDMEDDQAELYNSMVSELYAELDNGAELWAPGVLALLTRLRQINLDPRTVGGSQSSSKTEFIKDLVKNGPNKLVIFSTFEQYVRILSKELDEMKVGHITLSGKTPTDQIRPMVDRFQEDPFCRVAVGTIKVMGQGLTLHAASDVVLADRWWTPAANNQAVDRLHRPGQKNAVQVLLLTNDKSIDATLDEILERKKGESELLLNDSSVIQEVLEDLRRVGKV